jgi:hypothetical protein
MNAPRLTGGRCQCPTCSEHFTSDRTFDRHRIGQFAKPGERRGTRRCLTVAEMVADGWVKNARGFWTNVAPQPAHIDVAAPRGTSAMQPHRPAPALPAMHTSDGAS